MPGEQRVEATGTSPRPSAGDQRRFPPWLRVPAGGHRPPGTRRRGSSSACPPLGRAGLDSGPDVDPRSLVSAPAGPRPASSAFPGPDRAHRRPGRAHVGQALQRGLPGQLACRVEGLLELAAGGGVPLDASASACLDASLKPVRLQQRPPRRSTTRRASAFASASVSADRLPDARDERPTASAMAPPTTANMGITVPLPNGLPFYLPDYAHVQWPPAMASAGHVQSKRVSRWSDIRCARRPC